VGDGWSAYPDAGDDHAVLSPVEPGRVVGIGAICALRPQHFDDARSQGFLVSEFVKLEDGRRVILHRKRGFTIGLPAAPESGAGALRTYETRDSITQEVLNTVLPDDDDAGEDHPWPWLAELARARGLSVTAEDLRSLSYEVVLTDDVIRWLAPT
jgi:hypothetical protein